MSPDDFKQAWQTQSSQTRLTIDADLLLTQVQRNQQDFTATIFWRDVREVGTSLLMVPVWFFLGAWLSLPWTWYLVVPALLWIAGFMLVDRIRHRREPPEPGEPLQQTAESLLTQVEHQIWLLQNILWWYLLPPTVALLAFLGHVAWQERSDGWWAALIAVMQAAFVVIVYAGIYWLNQRAVRDELEPRRQELLTLLTSLGDETTGGEYAMATSVGSVRARGKTWRSLFVAGLSVVALAALSAAAHFAGQEGEYPKRAPYTAIHWEGDEPVVKIGDEWFELVSLEGIAAEDIVAFSRRTYGNKWQKRFEEDLVEVLSKMGHEPKDTVRLVIRPLGSSETRTLEDVPMTEANRRAIYKAARARELRE